MVSMSLSPWVLVAIVLSCEQTCAGPLRASATVERVERLVGAADDAYASARRGPRPAAVARQRRGAAVGSGRRVTVAMDMNPRVDGCQDFVAVEAGATRVDGIRVCVFDPRGERTLWDIGYLGGINRGIALGHVPGETHRGRLTELEGRALQPVHPENYASVEPGFDPLFAGPEVQYVEGGFDQRGPVVIPRTPVAILEAAATLAGARAGDVFALYVGDMVTVWAPGHGAFSVAAARTLDTGGDAVPDGTPTVAGIDGDRPIPVPPAGYEVDYVDGRGGAVILVVHFGDGDADGDVDLADVARFSLCFTGDEPGVGRACAAYDFDRDGRIDLADYRSMHDRITGP